MTLILILFINYKYGNENESVIDLAGSDFNYIDQEQGFIFGSYGTFSFIGLYGSDFNDVDQDTWTQVILHK